MSSRRLPQFPAVIATRGSSSPEVDLSSLPESGTETLHDPFVVASDSDGSPQATVLYARYRSMVSQAVHIESGISLLSGHSSLIASDRGTIASDTAARLRALVAQVPDRVKPISCQPRERIALLIGAATQSNVPDFLGLIAGISEDLKGLIPDLPWLELSARKQTEYLDILKRYRDARAADSVAPKLRYLDDVFSRKLVPELSSDVAYFQAVAMMASYLHLEVPQREISIPIKLRFSSLFNGEDARRLLRCERFVLRDWIMQTGGDYAGVKIRLWEALDGNNAGGDVFMIDCMGTNSLSPVRDGRLDRMGVVSGVLADIDPHGICATAFRDLLGPITRRLQRLIPTDAVVVCTGHSLGATTAHRCYALLRELGYGGSYLIGYNGGAFSDPIQQDLAEHASVHASYILNKYDPVPFGGEHLLPGLVKTNRISYGGTIASPNPLFGVFRDPISHGNAEEVVAAYLGLPTACSIVHSDRAHQWLMHNINQAVMSWAPGVHRAAITSVLKPEPTRPEHRMLSYFSRPNTNG